MLPGCTYDERHTSSELKCVELTIHCVSNESSKVVIHSTCFRDARCLVLEFDSCLRSAVLSQVITMIRVHDNECLVTQAVVVKTREDAAHLHTPRVGEMDVRHVCAVRGFM